MLLTLRSTSHPNTYLNHPLISHTCCMVTIVISLSQYYSCCNTQNVKCFLLNIIMFCSEYNNVVTRVDSSFEMASSEEVDGVFDIDSVNESRTSENNGKWAVLGKQFPRSEVRFFTQVFILYVVIITCLVNLSLGKGDLSSLWITLLSSSIGYMLPSPCIQKSHKSQAQRNLQQIPITRS